MVEALAFIHGSLLLLGAGFTAAAAAHVHGRDASPEHSLARTWMVAWWGGLAMIMGLLALFSLVGAFGSWPFALFMALYEMTWLVFVASFAMLTMALLYIVIGRRAVWIPVAAYYVVIYLFLQYSSFVAPVGALVVDGGIPAPAYETTSFDLQAVQVLVIFMGIPPIVAVGLYATLFAQAPDASSRYRIAMSVTAFLLVLAATVAQDVFPAAIGSPDSGIHIEGAGWLMQGLFMVLAGWSALRIYHPAPWVQRRHEQRDALQAQVAQAPEPRPPFEDQASK